MQSAEQNLYRTGQKGHHGLCYTFEVYAPKGEPSKTSSHFGWEYAFVESSSQKMKIRKKSYECRPGQVMIYNAHEDHEELYGRSAESQVKSVVVPNDVIDRLLEDSGIKSSEVVFFDILREDDTEILGLLKAIHGFRKVRDASAVSFDSCLADLLIRTLLMRRHSHDEQIRGLSGQGRFPKTIDRVKRKIRENLKEEEYGLDQLANDVGMSKFHLVRIFRQSENKTPIQYRNLLRIEEAKKELSIESQEISELAFSLGFSDLSTFNKAFKRQTLLSPSQYRRKNSN